MNQKIVSIPQLQVSDFFGRQRQTFRNQQISKKSGYRMEARGVSICKSFIPVKEIRPPAENTKGKEDKPECPRKLYGNNGAVALPVKGANPLLFHSSFLLHSRPFQTSPTW